MPDDTFTIDFSSLDRFIDAYGQQAAAIVADEMLKAAKAVAFMVEARAKTYTPVDTGNLKGSIHGEAAPTFGGVQAVIGTDVPYAAAVEYGRKPGSAPPPPGSLLAWMKRRGIEPSREFALRMAIARRGVKPQPYLDRAYAELRADIQRRFDQVLPNATARLGAL